jgi:hypothetical protein
MSPRRQILKLKLAAMLGLKASFDADYSVRKRSTSVDSYLHKLATESIPDSSFPSEKVKLPDQSDRRTDAHGPGQLESSDLCYLRSSVASGSNWLLEPAPGIVAFNLRPVRQAVDQSLELAA